MARINPAELKQFADSVNQFADFVMRFVKVGRDRILPKLVKAYEDGTLLEFVKAWDDRTWVKHFMLNAAREAMERDDLSEQDRKRLSNATKGFETEFNRMNSDGHRYDNLIRSTFTIAGFSQNLEGHRKPLEKRAADARAGKAKIAKERNK